MCVCVCVCIGFIITIIITFVSILVWCVCEREGGCSGHVTPPITVFWCGCGRESIYFTLISLCVVVERGIQHMWFKRSICCRLN